MIGTPLKAELAAQGHAVRTLGRSGGGDYRWDARPGSVPAEALAWADGIVSLNGASLKRLPWTPAYRRLILTSRVQATAALADAIATSPDPPSVWVSASAVGVYGDRGDAELDETAPAGTGWLAEVVRAWEQATAPARSATRVVLARTGLVLGDTGVLEILAGTTRFGLGARVGPGTQWWPWVALADEARAIAFALVTPQIAGPVNLVGPEPATAATITRTVARTLHRPHWFVLPSPLIKAVMGGGHELLLPSQRVRPAVLLDAGFEFEYADVGTLIRTVYGR